MSTSRHCRALLVAGPASGAGKTTVTAALARRYRRGGLNVRVFKTGPDFLDPMILERASGAPVYQLDLWMGGEAHCRHLLYEAAESADVILIEGAMGLFDGSPSSADLAKRFGIPVLVVLDAVAMAQTFGALAFGLAAYDRDVPVVGIVANRVAGEGHCRMLAESLREGLRVYGWLPEEAAIALPDRHLGLHQACEIGDLERRIERAASALRLAGDLVPSPTTFTPSPPPPLPRALAGVRTGVASDPAFSFVYRANLEVLRALGADLEFFSPLADAALPQVDSLYLPGGYPELHLRALGDNRALHHAVRRHHNAGRPIYAECGGMLYLLDELVGTDGRRARMLGLLPGRATMQQRPAAIAHQSVRLPEGTLRGHTFHYSCMETPLVPLARGVCPNGGRTAEAVYRVGRLTASYVHHYFPSNPRAVAGLFAP